MLRGGTCDSELGSYPGQVMQCPGSQQGFGVSFGSF